MAALWVNRLPEATCNTVHVMSRLMHPCMGHMLAEWVSVSVVCVWGCGGMNHTWIEKDEDRCTYVFICPLLSFFNFLKA